MGRQHQLLPGLPGGKVTLQQMSCDNNARIKGLDITLDDPASFTRTDSDEWSDVSA